jgi:hypothetical protein
MEKTKTEIRDFGHGVYHFPYIYDEFGDSLSVFIANHPELEYLSSTPGKRVDGTVLHGYFVVFREKAQP